MTKKIDEDADPEIAAKIKELTTHGIVGRDPDGGDVNIVVSRTASYSGNDRTRVRSWRASKTCAPLRPRSKARSITATPCPARSRH